MEPHKLAGELEELAGNLWWSWNNDARELWRRVAHAASPRRASDLARNPLALARSLSPRVLKGLGGDAETMRLCRSVLRRFRAARKPRSKIPSMSWKKPVAYFSMEFGLHESLPIYAGGLGILAGDHLKSTSEEGVPLVGVGILYRRGYFRQHLTSGGEMKVLYPRLDFETIPASPVRTGRSELRVAVELPDGVVRAKVWKIEVGQVPLYLLDTDIPENKPRHRSITHYLYGGTREDRIRQEVLLGIGGVRALEALGISPSVWHLNEGHVAFLALERLERVRRESDLTPPEGLEAIAADTVFTTHTPVPEGNEVFDPALVRAYLADYAERAGLAIDDFLDLGLDHSSDGTPVFSMTVLALRLSRLRNGVSALHGAVARSMWSFLWPSCLDEETPISSVTNGVHTADWVAPEIEDLLAEHVGADWAARLSSSDPKSFAGARKIPNAALWRAKEKLKRDLVEFVRAREDARLAREGWSEKRRRAHVEKLLDPDAFTIGFARRFALYKRAALIFRDVKRAAKIFGSKRRPVQIIFAGKPHPEDPEGKRLYEEVARLARRREFRGRVVVLENYDTEVCRYMVRGVDVWLNNPRRPLEASGTSGQKVPVNAGLNVSILDGWWEEGYAEDTGWAFGRPVPYDDPDEQDEDDVRDLYRVLEKEVVPLYYDRTSTGIPAAWLKKVKASMVKLVPEFSSNRMVVEYAERFYKPAAAYGRRVGAQRGRVARDLTGWAERVGASWSTVHLRGGEAGPKGSWRGEAYLGGIDPAYLVCLDEKGDAHGITIEKELGPGLYRIRVAGVLRGRSPGSTSLRLFPTHPELFDPLELGLAIEFRV